MTTSHADEFYASAFGADISPGTSWISSGGQRSGAETGLPGVISFERCLVQNPSAPTSASGGGTMIFIDNHEIDPNNPAAVSCESPEFYTVSTFIVGCSDGRIITVVTNEYPQGADPNTIDGASLDLLEQFLASYGAESFDYIVSSEIQSGGDVTTGFVVGSS